MNLSVRITSVTPKLQYTFKEKEDTIFSKLCGWNDIWFTGLQQE